MTYLNNTNKNKNLSNSMGQPNNNNPLPIIEPILIILLIMAIKIFSKNLIL